jgi:hypothetical protein
MKLKKAAYIATIIGALVTMLAMLFDDDSLDRIQVFQSGEKSQNFITKDGTINIYNNSAENKTPKSRVQQTLSKLKNEKPRKTKSNMRTNHQIDQGSINYASPSSVIINLLKPSTADLKIFKDTIQIEGKVDINAEGSVFNFMREENLVLIPVIEGSEIYTYDSLPVNSDGSFRYNWPISSEQIKGNTFWVGLFDRDGIIQSRERYNTSPRNRVKFMSDLVYFR